MSNLRIIHQNRIPDFFPELSESEDRSRGSLQCQHFCFLRKRLKGTNSLDQVQPSNNCNGRLRCAKRVSQIAFSDACRGFSEETQLLKFSVSLRRSVSATRPKQDDKACLVMSIRPPEKITYCMSSSQVGNRQNG